MTRRIFMMIYITLATLVVVALQYLFLSDYLSLFAFLNPIILIGAIFFFHPTELGNLDDESHQALRRRQLANQIDHTINTPLTKIIAQSDRALDAKQCSMETLKRIHQHALQLKQVSGIYTKYLNIISFQAERLVPIDYSELLRNSIIQHLTIIEDKMVDYRLNMSKGAMLINGNEALIQTSIDHIIHYVFQHCTANSTLTINCKSDSNRCHVLIYCQVDDTAQQQLSQMKNANEYSDQPVELSLALAELINHLHNGTLDYNTANRGWHISVELPSFSSTLTY